MRYKKTMCIEFHAGFLWCSAQITLLFWFVAASVRLFMPIGKNPIIAGMSIISVTPRRQVTDEMWSACEAAIGPTNKSKGHEINMHA